MTDHVLKLRAAKRDDLNTILSLLRDDVLGAARETTDQSHYIAAFNEILKEPTAHLLVAVLDGEIIGCAQVNVLANLSLQATKRANIEGVRIASTHRAEGLGEAFFDLIEAFCREQGCGLMQLTTNASRDAALRFYVSQGFEASHVGLKKPL